MITFRATVGSRSSINQDRRPPGETEVLALNPQRRERIIQAADWNDLFPGSLNLEVEENAVHQLLLCEPVLREKGEDVHYPEEYRHIPGLRVGYLYYRGKIIKGDSVASVLFRRACNPLPKLLEAFSEEKLRNRLGLSDGDSVVCEVDD